MDSRAPFVATAANWSPRLPSWALVRGRDISESDAAFAAGIGLKSPDDLTRPGSAAGAIVSHSNRSPSPLGCSDGTRETPPSGMRFC
nr:DUF1403 family protein [Agrobacterium vitis]